MILTLARQSSTSAGERCIHPARALMGALLVLCLLLSQWVGYAHAIAHWHGNAAAHLQKAERSADASTGLFEHQKASGTCIALDAAALGAGLCSSALALPVAHAPQLRPDMLAAQRWLPAFSPLFSTRAPPLNA